MTKIQAKIKPEICVLAAKGHANAKRNEDGRDLVCCAISTIMTTLANSCARVEGVRTIYSTREGLACCVVQGHEKMAEEIHPRYQMAIDGLTALYEQYPDCMSVDIRHRV